MKNYKYKTRGRDQKAIVIKIFKLFVVIFFVCMSLYLVIENSGFLALFEFPNFLRLLSFGVLFSFDSPALSVHLFPYIIIRGPFIFPSTIHFLVYLPKHMTKITSAVFFNWQQNILGYRARNERRFIWGKTREDYIMNTFYDDNKLEKYVKSLVVVKRWIYNKAPDENTYLNISMKLKYVTRILAL